VLVASDDLIQLIAMGSSLQKQAGLHVRMSRGAADTIDQARQHRPAAAVIDLRLEQQKTPEVFAALAELDPVADVILMVDERERRRAETITKPAIVRVIVKPLPLLNLAASVTSATGLETAPASAESAEILRQEILRVMELSRAAAGA
jgi:DNA-binding NtrC family response regulator